MDSAKINSLRRLQYGRQQLNDLCAHVEHVCDPNFCNPLSEIDFIRRGILQPPIVCNNLWLCRYGSYHQCSLNECNRATEGVCPISGITFLEFTHKAADYDEMDQRTWNQPAELVPLSAPDPHLSKRRKRKNLRDSSTNLFEDAPDDEEEPQVVEHKKQARTNGRLGKAEAQRRIEKMIVTLLFDPVPRRAAACHQMAYIEDRRVKRWRNHVQQCKNDGTIVNLIEQMIADSNLSAQIPRPITPHIEVNLDKQRYYVNLLMELYDKAAIYLPQPKVDVEAMSLAALYCMRSGFVSGNVTVLPADAYLAENLPHINDLPMFQYPKRKITKGTKLVKELFLRARQSGARNSELQLQMSIPTEGVMRQVREERLFMPTSRKRKN